MKIALTFFLISFQVSITYGQYTAIPDANFEQKLIDLSVDSEGMLDGQILTVDAQAQTILDVSSSSISDLTGIEAFINLTYLNCSLNQISSLNFSTLTSIDRIDCNNNLLNSLNLSNCSLLKTLYCNVNNLSTISVSSCSSLEYLNCSFNQITSLNMSSNSSIDRIDCNNNLLNSMNLTSCTLLKTLNCYRNDLASVDLTPCPILEVLNCSQNKLSNLDLSSNSSLTFVHTNINLLSSMDIGNGQNMAILNSDFNTTNNPSLNCIDVDDGDWSTTNWTNIDGGTVFSEDCSLLPVKLFYFLGRVINGKIHLNWSTATEFNNSGFEIQKSKDGRNWAIINFVDGKGTTNEINEYNYRDSSPFSGINYYRLKQIDFDGVFEYSNVIIVEQNNSDNNVQVFPNPSNRLINIQIANPPGERMNVSVIDNLGRTVWESDLIEGESSWKKEMQIDRSGIYFITAQIGDDIYYERVIITDEK